MSQPMQPVLASPLHDPGGVVIPHLVESLPDLQQIYGRLYLGITSRTEQQHPDTIAAFEQDPFIRLHRMPDDKIGVQFLSLYHFAVNDCIPAQPLHLAFVDRLAFLLKNGFAPTFRADMAALSDESLPVCFLRSPAAWQTHPRNYYEIEQFATRTGELLFGCRLDYGWCHLALTAGQLQGAFPFLKGDSLAVMAELILALRDRVRQKEVDWLAWEDPFLLSVDPQVYKAEREHSREETEKRLGYVLPILQRMLEWKD